MGRLLEKLSQKKQAAQSSLEQDMWDAHGKLERGKPIRIYEGTSFGLKRIAKEHMSKLDLKG